MPSPTLTKAQLKTLINAANAAPTGGNIQPWQIKVHQNLITVGIDPQRSPTLLDVDCLATIFSMGGFCYNLEITASQMGFSAETKIHSPKLNQKFSAKVKLSPKTDLSIHPHAKYIFKRSTIRKLHKGPLIKPNKIKKLINISLNYPQISLQCFQDVPTKTAIIDILGKADAFRTTHTQLLQQMLEEIRWNEKEVQSTKDGIDIKTLELPPHAEKMLRLLKRFPHMAKLAPPKALEDQAKPVLNNSSHICILSLTTNPNPKLLFQAGHCLQSIWLEATKLNLSIQPWTVLPFFAIRAKYYPNSGFTTKDEKLIKKLYHQLIKVLNLPSTHHPIFIFRLSKTSPPTTVSLRRDWTDFTQIVP